MIRFACPECGSELVAEAGSFRCTLHGLMAETSDGIVDFLRDHEEEAHAGFIKTYRELRAREERGSTDPEWYRRLPNVLPGSRHEREWRLRAQSLGWLADHLRRVPLPEGGWALDAGAGNCWLAHHIVGWGWPTVALDLNLDDRDGLGAGRHYTASILDRMIRLRSPFERLPFNEETFDLVVFNGSFHYALNDRDVIAEAVRVLRRGGGRIIILDSPFYRDPASGEKMLSERAEPGRAGYLVYDTFSRLAGEFGMEAIYHLPHVGFLRRMKRRATELRLGRETAAMPGVVLVFRNS